MSTMMRLFGRASGKVRHRQGRVRRLLGSLPFGVVVTPRHPITQ